MSQFSMLLQYYTLAAFGLLAGLALATPQPPYSQYWSSHPACPTASSAPLRPTATIDIGVVIGTTTVLPSATASVNKFLGIPFAKSPPERFSPATAALKLIKPLEVKAWKPACIQQFAGDFAVRNFTMGIFNEPPPEESEDCLYINVYAPSSPPPPGGRAVMFWIFGGALEFGTAGLPLYDGSAFAAYQDVILVSANYRTNVFGFPNSPELPLTGQNLGYLDQHFALEWTQTNIHAFGGDPAKITIFGESAGAGSVDALLTCTAYNGPGKQPPFRAAILESGQISYDGLPSATNSTESWLALAKALNCTSSKSQLACVRAAPALEIKTILENPPLFFDPVHDNVTRVVSPASVRAAGNFAKVPVLGGTNAQEGRIFEFSQNSRQKFINTYIKPVAPQIVPAVKSEFPVGDDPGYNTGYDIVSDLYTLLEFQCGQALWANETAAQGIPTWRYYYNASFPNFSPLGGILGVFHLSEIIQVFQTYAGGPVNPVTPEPEGLVPTNQPPTAQQEALSKYMNGAWATFAKNPIGGPGWNKLGTFAGDDLGVLGTNGSAGVTVISPAAVDGPCAVLLPEFRALNGDVYGLGDA